MAFHSLNDLMSAHEDYKSSYYLGKVTNNNDPLGFNRIQVSVPGLYDPQLGEVPWVGAKKDSPFGFGPNYGVYGSPQVGSTVIIELQNGDEHKPLYSTFPTAPNANPNFGSPNLWGFEDPVGNMVIYNLATKTYSFVTASGVRIDIDGSGNRTTTVQNDTSNVGGNLTINVSGSATIKAGGSVDFEAGGTATYKATAHNFTGPITTDQSISAGTDITDNTSGVPGTMRGFRELYNTHDHQYDDGTTSVPNQQIPTS